MSHAGVSVPLVYACSGCPLVCVHSSLARHGIAPARHYQLHQYGVKKRKHEDFDAEQAAKVLARVQDDLLAMHSSTPIP